MSTDDQTTRGQRDGLKAAGCARIYEDVASGADQTRPELLRCLESLHPGDTLVVARLDRLGRSLRHLLDTVSSLSLKGVHFKSLAEAFDTSSAQGRLMMHMLGAFAEFERELIRERTLSGLAAAKARGKVAGNPAFRAGDRAAIAGMKATQADTFTNSARALSRPWIGMVSTLRPRMSWDEVHRRILARHPATAPKTVKTLMRRARRLVSAGDLPQSVLERTATPKAQDAALQVARLREEHPQASLRRLGELLEEAGVHPPRAERWSAVTVSRLLPPRSS